MEFINGARHVVADLFVANDKHAREHLVVLAKTTYRIPDNDRLPRAITPEPLATEDLWTGEPGLSAALYETDYVRHKPQCDVIFNASAHSPKGQAVTELDVAFAVGERAKTLHVVGERHWLPALVGLNVSRPQSFVNMPLHYGMAFGGTRCFVSKGEEQFDSHALNPIGKGYSRKTPPEGLELPNLIATGQDVQSANSHKHPRAFSVRPRNHPERLSLAGTYDEAWRRDVFPLYPQDFDERFFQCAPEDQQVPYPQGGEQVQLRHMMKGRPLVSFKLPRLNTLPLKILKQDYSVHTPAMVVDTLYFEPDPGRERFSVVWRASLPLRKGLQEVQTIALGAVCKNWWEAKVGGRPSCGACQQARSTDKAPKDCDTEAGVVT